MSGLAFSLTLATGAGKRRDLEVATRDFRRLGEELDLLGGRRRCSIPTFRRNTLFDREKYDFVQILAKYGVRRVTQI